MSWLNIRTLLTVALSLLLASFGVYLGLQLPHFNGIQMLYIPSGEDLIKASPAYQATTTVALALVGLLLGFYLGPRLGEIIVRAGRSLEMASAADKIAVGIGTALGVLVTLLGWPWIRLILQPFLFDEFLVLLMAVFLGGGMFVASIILRLLGRGK